MTSGSRRNGRSKFGPFNRVSNGQKAETNPNDPRGLDLPYAGRHAGARGKTARTRVGKAVPAAAVAATLAAGAAAYLLVGGNAPHAAQLSEAMSAGAGSVASPVVTATSAVGGGSVLVKVATAHAPQLPAATAAATAKPTAKPSVKPSVKPAAAPTGAATPAASQSPSPSASPSSSSSRSSQTLSCDLSGGLLPANASAIVSFLLANGYSDNAAAGIAGNIYQESKGNPESEGMGGGGLIGWTPLPSGYVSGDVSADLETQLNALLSYNEGWSQYLSELNHASSPASAAYIYVTEFERAGIPAASTREAAATDVAAACGI